MPTESLTGARYPAPSVAPNVSQDIQNAVTDLASKTIPRFASASARDTAYSSWVSAGNTMVDGLTCYTQNDDRYWTYRGGWVFFDGLAPAVTVRRTTGPTGLAINQWAVVVWEALVAEDTTDTSMWTSSNSSRLIAPVSGNWLFSGSMAFGSGNGQRILAARKNGQALSTYKRMNSGSAVSPEMPFLTRVRLAAGEYVELMYYTVVAGDTVPVFGEIQPRAELTWVGSY